LYNLFADPDIIRLPPFLRIFQSPLAYFIAKTRYRPVQIALSMSPVPFNTPPLSFSGRKSREAYECIGGGSPIVKYTT
jgi:ferrochelatase